MTRRDAALVSLTLAGLWCLFQALTISFATLQLIASRMPRVDRLLLMMPMLLLTLTGVTLIQSRRKFATWMFGANPSHDSTAAVDAGDMRLLVVRVAGLLLLVPFAQSLRAPNVTTAILGASVLLSFLAARHVVRWLFAAGPGDGASSRYRSNFAFALGVIGAYYVVRFSGDAVEGIIKRSWTESAAAITFVIAGLALLAGRRLGAAA